MSQRQRSLVDFDALIKLVLLGDSGVGKTSILRRLTHNDFNPFGRPTICVDSATKFVTLGVGTEVVRLCVQVWDTSGQEQYRALTNAYYRGAMGAILMYDVTQQSSFESVSHWLHELRGHADRQGRLVIMLVGNKSDLVQRRVVPIDSGRAVAEKEHLLFMEASAADGSIVEPAFLQEIQEIYNTIKTTWLEAEPPAGQVGTAGVRRIPTRMQ